MPPKNQGMSLMELLVAVLLASLLGFILCAALVSTKKQYHLLQKSLTNTEELMFLTKTIRNQIRQSGFTPCTNISRLKTIDNRNNTTNISGIIVKEHLLQSTRMSEHFAEAKRLSENQIQLLTPLSVKTSEAILLADCFHAEVHTVHAITSKKTVWTLTHPLHFSYQEPLYVGIFLQETLLFQQGELYYKRYQQKEALSNAITAFAATIHPPSTTVIVHFTMQNGKTSILETRPRTP